MTCADLLIGKFNKWDTSIYYIVYPQYKCYYNLVNNKCSFIGKKHLDKGEYYSYVSFESTIFACNVKKYLERNL